MFRPHALITLMGASVPPPTNSVAPSISGTLATGATWTVDVGTWANGPSYSYQWKRGGVAIGSATNSTYALQAADAGTTLTCTVTATNSGGQASATSAGTAIPSLLDAFTDTNGTLMTAHTMTIGAGWAATNGVWEIQSNKASAKTLTSSYALALADAGVADVTVTALVQRQTVNYVCVAFRGADSSNFWIAGFNNATILLVRRVANSPTVVTSAAFTSSTGVDVALQVVASGTTITVYADGVQKLTTGTATQLQTNTKCGIYAEGVGNLVENFQVS